MDDSPPTYRTPHSRVRLRGPSTPRELAAPTQRVLRWILAGASLALTACGHEASSGWEDYAADPQSTRYAAFDQIDATNFEKEPVARIHLPVRVPFGFHGSWIPDAD